MRHHLGSLLYKRSVSLRFSTAIGSVLLLLASFSALQAEARQLVIYKSHDYVSHNYEIQHFVDTLTVQAGQLEVPISMTIYNGSTEAPSFKWFRILINGEIIATEQDLHGREEGVKDVSGIIRGTNNQVQIEAAGVPGANLWWTLNADQMEFTGAVPSQVNPGQELRLIGSSIPQARNMVSVVVNGKPARVISVEQGSIVIQMPESAGVGTNDIQVKVGSQTSNVIPVNVVAKPVPEILSMDVWMAPPGGTLNISGRNFSSSSGDNQVYFGTVAGTVNSASSTQLSVIVPNWSWGPNQLNIPVTVVVGGVRSNSFPFDIGPMYHGGTPSFGHN